MPYDIKDYNVCVFLVYKIKSYHGDRHTDERNFLISNNKEGKSVDFRGICFLKDEKH